MGEQNSLAGKSIPRTSGKKWENEKKLFHKNLCETGGENEREFCFNVQFQLKSNVFSV